MWNSGLQAIDSINLYQSATVELIKGLTFRETVVINRCMGKLNKNCFNLK